MYPDSFFHNTKYDFVIFFVLFLRMFVVDLYDFFTAKYVRCFMCIF